jgi:hypothetical protein
MKPLGGKFVNKLQSASDFNTKRGHSLVDINAPLQTKYLKDPNPVMQLQTVKESFN